MKKRSYPFKILRTSEIWNGHIHLKSCERFAVYAQWLCHKTVMVVAVVRAAVYSKTYTSKEANLPGLLELIMDHASTPAEDEWIL